MYPNCFDNFQASPRWTPTADDEHGMLKQLRLEVGIVHLDQTKYTAMLLRHLCTPPSSSSREGHAKRRCAARDRNRHRGVQKSRPFLG